LGSFERGEAREIKILMICGRQNGCNSTLINVKLYANNGTVISQDGNVEIHHGRVVGKTQKRPPTEAKPPKDKPGQGDEGPGG